MSFILDALKKSEERRQQEEQVSTRKRVLTLGESGRRRWPLWLVLTMIPVALLAGWWLGKSPHLPAPKAMAQVAQLRNTPAEPLPDQALSTTIATSTAPLAVPPQPAQPVDQNTTAGEPALTSPAKPRAQAVASPVPVPAAAPVPAPVPVKPAHKTAQAPQQATSETAEPPTSLPTYNDLSRELRERLPLLDISLHFFSTTPKRRMVRINGRLLHQGEAVADGLAIHEITASATILDYQGLLFEIQVPGR
jgi:general secretion pathway protein B